MFSSHLHTDPGQTRPILLFAVVRVLLVSLLCGGLAARQAEAAPTPAVASAAPLLMGFQFGLAVENHQALNVIGQALSDVVSNAVNRKVLWLPNFNLKTAEASSDASRYSFAFVKPPNLTAALLAKGWQLVAVGKDTMHFGTDLIARQCPNQAGKILVGGGSLSVLGLSTAVPETCISPDEAWSSPSAVLLAPQKGSLVDMIAQKLWLGHAKQLPKVVYVKTQNAVTGLMRDMQVAAIGVVTPVVSKQWLAEGGVLLQHQPMPMWAVLAAPSVPEDSVAKVRADLLGAASERANKALGLTGWEVGSPKAYADFLKWLKS
ncbi:MAG: hypothetical protein PHO55_04625 [Thiomonas arsenitoxydans]|nr:hypothetical protein [Thiomonas arsenitoxydans]CQR41723.1 conserved exported hypothetical protein [Thiomonas sp. CB3]